MATIAGTTARIPGQFQDHGGVEYNLKHPQIGAVGNGATDDRPAFVVAEASGTNIVVPEGTYLINSNITLTKKYKFAKGALIKPASGVTVTISAENIDAGFYQIFDISAGGTVTYSATSATVADALPQWWGSLGDGVTSDRAGFQAAINALNNAGGGQFIAYKPSVRYLIDSRLVGYSNIIFTSLGCRPTIRYTYEQQAGDPDWYQADSVGLFYIPDEAQNVVFRDLKLEYTGTYNPPMSGPDSTGKISGIRLGRTDNTLIEDCEITGFNRHGITCWPVAYPGSLPLTNTRIVRCNIHYNRQAGIWITHNDGVLVDDCDLYDMGLITDQGTGYGFASSGYSSNQYPTNVTIQNCRVYNNNHRGIDFHRGKNIIIQDNRLWAPTTTGVVGEQLVHIAVQDVLEGNIKILNNDIRTMRNRGAAYPASTTGIDIRWPSGVEGTGPLRIEIDGNTFSDINVSGVNQVCQCILFESNNHKDTDVIISNNQIDADNLSYFIITGQNAVIGTLVKKRWTVINNQFKTDNLQGRPIQIGNATELIATGNEVTVLGLTSVGNVNPLVLPIAVSGQSIAGKSIVSSNTGIVPSTTDLYDWINSGSSAQERGNSINGKPLPDRFLGYEASTLLLNEQIITNTALPKRIAREGARALVAIPPEGTFPGWICVDTEPDTIAVQANATDTVIAIASSFLMRVNDQFAILLDNNIYHWSTITAISGNNVTIADAIPAGRTSPVGNAVQAQRWEPVGLVKPTVAKTAAYSALNTDHTILCDATAGAFTVTLPRVATCKGHILVIKKIDASVNAVTIDGFSTETIDDTATKVLSAQYAKYMIQSDGVEWWILAS